MMPGSAENASVGLGMSICKQLVELMDGRIWIVSALGQGTNVSVLVPFQVSDSAARVEQPPPASMEPRPAAAPSLSILVVEDNDYNIDVCKEILTFMVS